MSNAISATPPLAGRSHFVSRRQFIQLGAAGLGAAWLGLLAQARLFPPQPAGQTIKPVTFALSDLPVGSFKQFLYGGAPAIVLRTPESVRAFSLICTHLGCTVIWQPEKGQFHCPCHDGRFDQFGEVLAGPPPVPLESLPVSVQGGQVVVGEA